jgi:hypothetical protein
LSESVSNTAGEGYLCPESRPEGRIAGVWNAALWDIRREVVAIRTLLEDDDDEERTDLQVPHQAPLHPRTRATGSMTRAAKIVVGLIVGGAIVLEVVTYLAYRNTVDGQAAVLNGFIFVGAAVVVTVVLVADQAVRARRDRRRGPPAGR